MRRPSEPPPPVQQDRGSDAVEPLDAQAGESSGIDELLDLPGTLEDVVGQVRVVSTSTRHSSATTRFGCSPA
jgi:hypothetical protein